MSWHGETPTSMSTIQSCTTALTSASRRVASYLSVRYREVLHVRRDRQRRRQLHRFRMTPEVTVVVPTWKSAAFVGENPRLDPGTGLRGLHGRCLS